MPTPTTLTSVWPNSANAPDQVHTSDTDAIHHPQGHWPRGPDAIREGKERAKEVMAAQASSASPAPTQQSNAPNGSTQRDGTPLSRKRSRDGSQLPATQNGNSSGSASNAPFSRDEVLLDRYLQRDLLHAAAMNDQAERTRELVHAKEKEKEFYLHEVQARRRADPGSVFGYGFAGYGNGTTNARSQIVYSVSRGPPKGRRSKEVHIPRKDKQQQAEQHEELVPVRLDIELDKLRLRDTFTWNLHEKCISQDQFADYLLEDLKLPPEAILEVSRQVKAEMHEQIQNYYPHLIVEDGPLESGRPYQDHKDDEMRIQIKLNLTIGRITLIDQFEWDINNPLNSPEEFARQMAWENALSGEFTTAIAHSIREQSQQYTKALYLTNHAFDGRPIEDVEVKDSFLPAPLHSAFRHPAAQKDFTPLMFEMSEADLEKTETSMMREHRAQKRQLNRRGGPALPDLKDKPRTLRSLIVHSVIPGAVETFETTGIPKTRRSGRAGRRGGRVADGDIDSDDLDSEDSGAESPVPAAALSGGTARTRGMRGAAVAAQSNMRATMRSTTPDSQTMSAPSTEVRQPSRPSRLREESTAVDDDEEEKIVVLKIGRAKLKAWWDGYQAKKRAKEFPLSGYASGPSNPPPATPARGVTSTPNMTPRSLPPRGTSLPNGSHSRATSSARTPSQRTNVTYDSKGAVDTDHWPGPDEALPAPPPWLQQAMSTLRNAHPDDNFVPFMRPYTVDTESGEMVKVPLQPGDPAPDGVKIRFLPRIRCNDCPSKVYTAVPDRVINDFEVHLRNKKHLEAVQKRIGGG